MNDEVQLGGGELRRVLDAALTLARVAAAGTPEALADVALTQALALVPADRATFFVVDPLTDELVRLTWREREAPQPARFAPGSGAVGWAIAHRSPLLLTDVRRDPRYQPIRYPSMKSMLVVPLEWDGRVNGALACSGWSADAFEARHLEMLRLFCQHVAAALAGASRSAGEDPATVPARSLAEYAHEVRGALHTALGYLSLVAEEPNPRLAEAIAGARRACQQAVEIGDAVLDAAADEQRGATAPPVGQPVVRPTDLIEVVRRCVERVGAAAGLRGIRIELAAEARECVVLGRRQTLERLIDNLLLNAVEHSPEGGQVCARLAVQGDRAVVLVEDDGPGIPEADLEKIFTPFFRVTAGKRGRSGGLGLTLARRWATQAGGRLWAENRHDGGARLVLQLPLAGSGAELRGSLGFEPLEDE